MPALPCLRDGDWHKAVHVWLLVESTKELLVQRRARDKDSWPGRWDISSAGHVEAGQTCIEAARRELEEELGVSLPEEAFLPCFVYKQAYENTFHGKHFVNNEFDFVYLVVLSSRKPLQDYQLQKEEVEEVRYMDFREVQACLASKDPNFVDAYHVNQGNVDIDIDIDVQEKGTVQVDYQKLFQMIATIYSNREESILSKTKVETMAEGQARTEFYCNLSINHSTFETI